MIEIEGIDFGFLHDTCLRAVPHVCSIKRLAPPDQTPSRTAMALSANGGWGTGRYSLWSFAAAPILTKGTHLRLTAACPSVCSSLLYFDGGTTRALPTARGQPRFASRTSGVLRDGRRDGGARGGVAAKRFAAATDAAPSVRGFRPLPLRLPKLCLFLIACVIFCGGPHEKLSEGLNVFKTRCWSARMAMETIGVPKAFPNAGLGGSWCRNCKLP